MNRLRKLACAALISATVLAAQGASAGTAQAATNPYTPESACGSSYRRVLPAPIELKRTIQQVGTVVFGRLYLLYSSTTGYNCVALIKVIDVGVPTHTKVWISNNVEDPNGTQADEADFRYYASAKIYGRQRCVQFYGEQAGWGTQAAYLSPWGWCA